MNLFKNESKDQIITSAVGLSSKVYTADYEDEDNEVDNAQETCEQDTNNKTPAEYKERIKKKELVKFKGLPKSYVKNHLEFKMYKNCLMNQTTTKAKFWRMKTKNYKLSTKLQEKIALSSFDDKRLFELL